MSSSSSERTNDSDKRTVPSVSVECVQDEWWKTGEFVDTLCEYGDTDWMIARYMNLSRLSQQDKGNVIFTKGRRAYFWIRAPSIGSWSKGRAAC